MKLKNPRRELHSALKISGHDRHAQSGAEERFYHEQQALDQESRARIAENMAVRDSFGNNLGHEIASFNGNDARIVAKIDESGLHIFDPDEADELLRVSEHLPRGFTPNDDPETWIDD